MDITSDHEREIAAETARRAMIAGWDRAIRDVAAEKGITPLALEGILNKVSKDNPNRDPSARIDELNDWEANKQRNSELKRNSLHRLSPGLRAYMEKKQAKLGPS
jgi:hypothetical protein